MMRQGPPGSLQQLASFQAEKAKDTGSTARRLWGYIAPFKLELVGTLLLTLLSAVGQGLWPFLVGRAIDQYVRPGAGADAVAGLNTTALMLIAVFILMFVASRFQIVSLSSLSQKTLLALRQDIFNKVQRLPLRYFDKNPVGDVMSRLVNDTDTINAFLGQGLIQVLGGLFGLIAIAISMLLQNWLLALCSFIVIPIMVFATNYFGKLAREAYRKTRRTIGDVSADLQEELAGAKVAQAFNRTESNQRRFEERNDANRKANMAATLITSAFNPLVEFLSVVATAIVAGVGGWLALNGQITIGVVVAFLAYVQQMFRPLQALSGIWTQAQASFAGAERIFELVDGPDESSLDASASPAPANAVLKGDVEFRDVHFAYDSAKPVLRGVSFTVHAGQTIAIVGPTGSGKTTIINLLSRFYEPDAGEIWVDGQPINKITRATLRANMGAVPQDSFMFAGSIGENIRYGRLNASDADIAAAAEAANAAPFIDRLKQKYATMLGERGGGLSQGQRQLIGIARAVLANPRILLLDEATSSVDTFTESLIQRALNKLLKGRTSFVIAHRLSTIRDADLVLVLKDGQIVERGAHDDLLALNGVYAELYKRQFRQAITT